MKKLTITMALLLCFSTAAAANSFEVTDGYLRSVSFTLPEGVDSATAFCAVYAEDGSLGDVRSFYLSESSVYAVEDFAVADEAQLWGFLWESATMRPLCDSFTYSPPVGDGVIHFRGDTIDAAGVDGVSVSGGTLTITQPGEYTVEGGNTDGQIIVALPTSSDEVTINLAGVDLFCSYSAPFYASQGKVTLNLAEGSMNAFSEETYTADEPNACVFSKKDLTICGSGTLIVDASTNNGIGTKNDLKLKGGTIKVTAPNNALKGNESVTLSGADVTAISGGDGVKSDCTDEVGKGYVEIKSGKLTITSTDDGIQASQRIYFEGGDVDITAAADAIKSDMVIEFSDGDYTVVIDAQEDGIQATGDIEIYDGSFEITAQQDAIVSDANITIDGGDIYIKSLQDGIQSEKLVIYSGEFDITSGGGYNTSWSSTDTTSRKSLKGNTLLEVYTGSNITASSSEDTLHSNATINVLGGNLTLYAGDDGMHADTALTISLNPVINIKTSYEALEAAAITIKGGTLRAAATDDAINASDGTATEPGQGGTGPGGRPGQGGNWNQGTSNCSLTITGGYVYLVAGGDGLDSNGTISMTDGCVLVNGPTSGGNGVLDYASSFTMSGGTLVAAGTRDMAQSIGNASSVCAFAVTFSSNQNANSIFRLEDSSGNAIVTYAPSVNYQYVLVASPQITRGSSYRIYTGGYVSSTPVDGLYSGGTYSGGTLRRTVTANGVSTGVNI